MKIKNMKGWKWRAINRRRYGRELRAVRVNNDTKGGKIGEDILREGSC